MSKSSTPGIFTKLYEKNNIENCKLENKLMKHLTNKKLILGTSIVEVKFPEPKKPPSQTPSQVPSQVPSGSNPQLTEPTFEQTFINLENAISKKMSEMNMEIKYKILGSESSQPINMISTIAFSCAEAARNYAENIKQEQRHNNNTPAFAAACRSEQANETIVNTKKVTLKKELNDDHINGYFTGFITNADYKGETQPKSGLTYKSYDLLNNNSELKEITSGESNNMKANVYYSKTIDPLVQHLSRSSAINQCPGHSEFYTILDPINAPKYTPDSDDSTKGTVTIKDDGYAQLKRKFHYLRRRHDSMVKEKKIYFVGFSFNPEMFSDKRLSGSLNNDSFKFKDRSERLCNKYKITNNFPLYSCPQPVEQSSSTPTPATKEGFKSSNNELLGNLAESINDDVLGFQKNYSKFMGKQKRHIHLAKKLYGDAKSKTQKELDKISTNKRRAEIQRYKMKKSYAIRNILFTAFSGVGLYGVLLFLQKKTLLGSIFPDFIFSGLFSIVLIVVVYLLSTEIYDLSSRSKFNFDDYDTRTYSDDRKRSSFDVSGSLEVPENLNISIGKGKISTKDWNNILQQYDNKKEIKNMKNMLVQSLDLPKDANVSINQSFL